ncbi:MAG: BPSS1780 family membrane protein [Castellaniella sp.]
MQAATLPISAGWQWILDGYRLFMRQPAPMFFWSLVTGMLISISYLIPVFGQIALIGATPLLTFIILSACRRVASDQRMGWGLWLQPLRRDPSVRRRLFRLGMLYLAFCMAAGIVATIPFLNDLRLAVDAGGGIDERQLLAAMRGPFITFGLLYVLISALFWHAPALTGWHAIPIVQAMFYSMVACWRNKLPFLAYGAGWASIFFVFQLAGGLLTGMGLSFAASQLLMTPVNLVVAAVLYCSFYPAYVSVFGNHYPLSLEDLS